MTRIIRVAFAGIVLLVACAGAAMGQVTDLTGSDVIQGVIASAGETDSFQFWAMQGDRLSVMARAHRGSQLQLAARLVAPDGIETELASGRAGLIQLRRYEIAATGTYRLDVFGKNGTTGRYTAAVFLRRRGRRIRLKGEVGVGESYEYSFEAAAGSRVDLFVRSADGDLKPAAAVYAEGGTEPVGTSKSIGQKGARLRVASLPQNGTYTIRITGADGTAGAFKAMGRISPPRMRPNLITDPDLLPSVHIEASPTEGDVPLEVQFHLVVDGDEQPRYCLWYFGDGHVARGLDAQHTYQHGGRFDVVASAVFGPGLVAVERQTITVTDTQGPTLLRAVLIGRRRLLLVFDEPLDRKSAESIEHYSIDPSVEIKSARLLPTGRAVLLKTDAHELGSEYTIHVQGVLDQADPPNAADCQMKYMCFLPITGRKAHPTFILTLGADEGPHAPVRVGNAFVLSVEPKGTVRLTLGPKAGGVMAKSVPSVLIGGTVSVSATWDGGRADANARIEEDSDIELVLTVPTSQRVTFEVTLSNSDGDPLFYGQTNKTFGRTEAANVSVYVRPVRPSVTAMSPFLMGKGMSVPFSPFILRFSRPVDPETVSGSSIQVSIERGGETVHVSCEYTVRAGGLEILVEPRISDDDPMPFKDVFDANYSVVVNENLHGTDGSPFDQKAYEPGKQEFRVDSAFTRGNPLIRDDIQQRMTVARAYHTATLLQDGRVLVAGGIGADGRPLDTAEIWDPADQSFTLLDARMTSARAKHTATLLPDGKVLITGGIGSDGAAQASAELFDPTTESFVQIDSMTTARAQHTATLLADGRVLIAGGIDEEGNALASTEWYHPALPTSKKTGTKVAIGFTAGPGMNYARAGHDAVLLQNGQLLIGGGGGDVLFELLSADGESFSTAGVDQSPAYGQLVLLPDGKAAFIGGLLDAENILATIYIYDPQTGQTTTGPSTVFPRAGHCSAVLPNGLIYSTGGGFQDNLTKIAEVFDPFHGVSEVTFSEGGPQAFGAAVLLNDGSVLVTGGVRKDGPVATWWHAGSMRHTQGGGIEVEETDGAPLAIVCDAPSGMPLPNTTVIVEGVGMFTTDSSGVARLSSVSPPFTATAANPAYQSITFDKVRGNLVTFALRPLNHFPGLLRVTVRNAGGDTVAATAYVGGSRVDSIGSPSGGERTFSFSIPAFRRVSVSAFDVSEQNPVNFVAETDLPAVAPGQMAFVDMTFPNPPTTFTELKDGVLVAPANLGPVPSQQDLGGHADLLGILPSTHGRFLAGTADEYRWDTDENVAFDLDYANTSLAESFLLDTVMKNVWGGIAGARTLFPSGPSSLPSSNLFPLAEITSPPDGSIVAPTDPLTFQWTSPFGSQRGLVELDMIGASAEFTNEPSWVIYAEGGSGSVTVPNDARSALGFAQVGPLSTRVIAKAASSFDYENFTISSLNESAEGVSVSNVHELLCHGDAPLWGGGVTGTTLPADQLTVWAVDEYEDTTISGATVGLQASPIVTKTTDSSGRAQFADVTASSVNVLAARADGDSLETIVGVTSSEVSLDLPLDGDDALVKGTVSLPGTSDTALVVLTTADGEVSFRTVTSDAPSYLFDTDLDPGAKFSLAVFLLNPSSDPSAPAFTRYGAAIDLGPLAPGQVFEKNLAFDPSATIEPATSGTVTTPGTEDPLDLSQVQVVAAVKEASTPVAVGISRLEGTSDERTFSYRLWIDRSAIPTTGDERFVLEAFAAFEDRGAISSRLNRMVALPFSHDFVFPSRPSITWPPQGYTSFQAMGETIRWTQTLSNPSKGLYSVEIDNTSTGRVWEFVVPGTQTSLTIPTLPEAFRSFTPSPGDFLSITVDAAAFESLDFGHCAKRLLFERLSSYAGSAVRRCAVGPPASEGSFLSGVTLNAPTRAVRAVWLGGSRGLAVRGSDSNGVPQTGMELVDWTDSAAVIPTLHAHLWGTITPIGGTMYMVAGGKDKDGSATSNVLIYDAETGRVDETTLNMTTARMNHAACMLRDGSVFLCGGGDGKTLLASTEIFDPAQGTFQAGPPLGVPRAEHTATLLESGSVLIAGGVDGANATDSCEIFDPNEGTMRSVGKLSEPRAGHVAVRTADGRVFLIGGYGANGPLATIDVFDPVSESFSLFPASLPFEAKNLAACLISDGRILITGGRTSSDVSLVTAAVLDPADNTLRLTGSMQDARDQHAILPVQGGAAVIAGAHKASPLTCLPTTELFSGLADNNSPAVLRTKPGPDEQDVPVDTNVLLYFSEPIDPASVTPGTVWLETGGQITPTALAVDEERTMIVMAPLSPLTGGPTVYTVHVEGVIDTVGKAVQTFQLSFTTEDLTPPQVAFVTQDRNQGPSGAFVSVVFTEDVDPATASDPANYVFSGEQVVTEVVDVTGPQVDLQLASPVLPGVDTVDIANVEDPAGNIMDPEGGLPVASTDVTPPSIASCSVETVSGRYNDRILVTFDDMMVADDVMNPANYVFESPDGNPIALDQAKFEHVSAGGVSKVRITFVQTDSPVNLKTGATYTLSVDARDVGGNRIAAAGGTCAGAVTGDDVAPFITSVSPSPDAVDVSRSTTVLVSFSEEMNMNSVGVGVARLMLGDVEVPTHLIWNPDGIHLELRPLVKLKGRASYVIEVGGQAEDLAGNSLESGDFASTFTTEQDVEPPFVVSSNVWPLSELMPGNSKLCLFFSEEMDVTSFSDSTVRLERTQDETTVPVTWVFDDRARNMVIQPTSALQAGNYMLKIEGVLDTSGNVLDQDSLIEGNQEFLAWFDAVDLNDTQPPEVVSVLPLPNAQDVPTNLETIRVEWSEEVDIGTVTDATISLREADTGVDIPIWMEYRSGHRAARIHPRILLRANTRYELTVNGVSDLAGNPMEAMFVTDFETGAGEDHDPPFVVAASFLDTFSDRKAGPEDNIVVHFSEHVISNSSRRDLFFLSPGEDVTLGSGIAVYGGPLPGALRITLGDGATVCVRGPFGLGGVRSTGMDVAASIREGEITDLCGNTAVDLPVRGVDDAGVDIEPSLYQGIDQILPENFGGARDVCSADFNLDAMPDLFFARNGLNQYAVQSGGVTVREIGGGGLGMKGSITGGGRFVDLSERLPDGQAESNACEAADLDNDGDPDIVVANNGVNVLLVNQGRSQGGIAGDFKKADLGTEQRDSRGIAVADVDCDGDLDVIVANDSGPVDLYVNQGGAQGGHCGDFLLDASAMPSGNYAGRDVVAGDFDLDGDIDVVVACYDEVNRLLINQGRGQGGVIGTFREATVGVPSDIQKTVAMSVGDVDRDGDLDVLVVNEGASCLWLNLGGQQGGSLGLFAPSAAFPPVDGNCSAGELVDIDDDGDLDAVLVARDGAGFVVLNMGRLQGGPIGEFEDRSLSRFLAPPMTATGMCAVDLDVDGDTDIVVAAESESGHDAVLVNSSTVERGRYADATESVPPVGSQAMRAVAADFDLDGDEDVFVPDENGDHRLLRNQNSASTPYTDDSNLALPSSLPGARAAAAADFDCDGDLDIILATTSGVPVFLVNQGHAQGGTVGYFAEDASAIPSSLVGEWTDVAVGDIDLDGDVDIVLTRQASAYPSANVILFNKADMGEPGTFEEHAGALPNVEDDTTGVALFDADHDGDLDICFSNRDSGLGVMDRLLSNQGGLQLGELGSFVDEAKALEASSDSYGVEAFDADLDGYPDLIFAKATCNAYYRNVTYAEEPGNTVLQFVDSTQDAFGYDAYVYGQIAVCDMDLDGDKDLLFVSNTGTWLLENTTNSAGGDGSYGTLFQDVSNLLPSMSGVARYALWVSPDLAKRRSMLIFRTNEKPLFAIPVTIKEQ